MNPGATAYDTYSAGVVGSPDQNTYFTLSANAAHLLRVGTNTVAVELHQCNAASSDLYFDFSLTAPATLVNIFADITVTNDLTVKARAFDGPSGARFPKTRSPSGARRRTTQPCAFPR